jgi:hypothetical protein
VSAAGLTGIKVLAFGFVFFLALTLSSAAVFAQAISGNLRGTVVDPSGAAVSGATVEALNVATNQKVTTTTKGFGDYLFSDLPAGTYRITVSAPNFRTVTVENIPVDINKTGTTNIKLEIGSNSTTVEVSGAAPPVDTTTAQLQSTYTDRLSQDLGLTSAGGAGAGVLNL